MLEKLVSFDTVSCNSNLELIYFVRDYLNSHGVDSHLVFSESKNKANLYANIGPLESGGVILSGHTDVVPIDGQNWDTNPFKLTERNGRLFGRGACDMKGFNAIFLSLVPEMLQAKMKKPIQLALSYDEEVGCVGAPLMIKEMRENLPKAESVIVGEPTLMKLVDGHKASIGIQTEITGYEVHSSLLPSGVSAVMASAKLINWISEKNLENSRKQPHSEDLDFFPSYTTLHVGKISGGTASNITAKKCVFSLDIRCLPSENGEEYIQSYEKYGQELELELKKTRPESRVRISRHHWVTGLKPEKDGTAEKLVRKLTGDNLNGKVSYGTEAGQFQEHGYSVVICGPGSIKQAHQPNEYLALNQLELGTKFIRSLITELSE